MLLSLNALLAALALPFTLDHPSDLTPSLLLAIFESLISARLPIPASVRQSRTRDAKARAMLVLLGVLECDILRGGEHSVANADDSVGGVSVDGWVDEIGLGEVDPERLADGGWEETIFVGELLCWLARRKGILPRTSSHRSSHPRSLYSNHHSYGTEEGEADFSTSLLLRPAQRSPPQSSSPPTDDVDADFSHITDVPRHPLVHSPEPSLSASATTGTDLSIRARSVSSRTTVSITHDEPDDQVSQDTVQMYDPRRMMQDAEEDDDLPPTFRPRCIHELEDPSYIRALGGPSSSFDPSASQENEEDGPSRDQDEQDNDDPYAPPTPTPRRVRLTGWIDPVDAATEFSHFDASRAHSRSRASAGSGSGPLSQVQPQAHTPRLKADVSPRPHPGMGKSRTPRRASPSPSPSPPSSPPPASLNHPPPRSPSPPSPAHSDPPFDVSFSTFNNTSTPAKPRPPRRPQFQTTTRHEIAPDARAERGKGRGGVEAAIGTGCPRRRDRSPSYTPSPPSFSTSGSAGATLGTGSSGPKTRVGASTPVPLTRQKNMRSTSPSPMNTPPPVSPPGSTTTTSSLLTERARLLTELAALKRARAASGGRVVGVGV